MSVRPLTFLIPIYLLSYPSPSLSPFYLLFSLSQPAYVDPSAPENSSPGKCLTNGSDGSYRSTCDASYPVTHRLCPCADETQE